VSSQPGEPSEEEIRAALDEEMKRVHVQDVLLQSVVSLVNLGARRAGLAPGTEGERDIEQTRLAIDAVRAVLPLLEPGAPEQVSAIRDAVSQLQMAYVRAGGTPPAGGEGEPAPQGPPPSDPEPPPQDPGPGPARSSGRLWVPGQ
jgi:hypothetical protein